MSFDSALDRFSNRLRIDWYTELRKQHSDLNEHTLEMEWVEAKNDPITMLYGLSYVPHNCLCLRVVMCITPRYSGPWEATRTLFDYCYLRKATGDILQTRESGLTEPRGHIFQSEWDPRWQPFILR